MPLSWLLGRREHKRVVFTIYAVVMDQARLPAFYTRLGVPDTLDGRFDLLILHAILLMRRLGIVEGASAEPARALSQRLFDLMFADFDQNLREMGVGDLAVGKKIRQMAEAFQGRLAAYDRALAGGGDLDDALARNLYRGLQPAALQAMAGYVRAQVAHLDGQDVAAIVGGNLTMIPPLEE